MKISLGSDWSNYVGLVRIVVGVSGLPLVERLKRNFINQTPRGEEEARIWGRDAGIKSKARQILLPEH